jgi:hypothetical protein
MPAGRPHKQGLDYFSFDTTMEEDRKIQLLESSFPEQGWTVWTKLLIRIYRYHGYFFELSEDNLLLFSRRINVNINSINDIIKFAVRQGLFDRGMYERHKILTSKSIQDRWLHVAHRRRTVFIIEHFWLLERVEKLKSSKNIEFLIFDKPEAIIDNINVISDYINIATHRICYCYYYDDIKKTVLLGSKNTVSNKKGESFENSKLSGQNFEKKFEENSESDIPSTSPPPTRYLPGQKVSTAMRTNTLDWELEKLIFEQDEQWCYNFARNYGEREEEIRRFFPVFFKMLENRNQQKRAEEMFRHFNNWWPSREITLRSQLGGSGDINKAARRGTSQKDYDENF